MTDEQRGWVAGIIEGEGTFIVQYRRAKPHHNISTQLSVRVTMTDEDTIQRLQEWTGMGRINGPYQDKEFKPYWRWSVQRRADVAAIVAEIYPLLSKRRKEQADRLDVFE